MQFQDEREILCQMEKKYFVKSFPTQRPKGAQTPSNCHISPKCWQNISNTNIFILLTHVSQPSARRAHRHPPTVIYPPNVGRKYPIQIYLFNWHICNTLCAFCGRWWCQIVLVPMEAVRPYSTKPGTQEMSLMALTLYFLTQTLYTKYKIEERPPLE